MSEVELWMGAWASARAELVEQALAEAPGGLLVTPSQAQARVRRERLARQCGGAWGPTVLPLTDFAAWILRDARTPHRRLDDFERYLLLRQCLQQLEASGELPRLATPCDTPGLVRHLLRIITQLKQCALEPEDFQRRMGGASALEDFDALVATAYRAYQARLKAMRAYDVPGLYWEAAIQTARKAPDFLQSCTLLCFDGFDDFTPSEFRLLESLKVAGPDLLFGVNHDPAPSRRDLFLLPRATCERIQQIFTARTQVFETPPAASHAAFAAANLFWRDPPSASTALEPDLRILPCMDLEHEVESLARCIKQALHAGVSAHRIALVFGELEQAAPAVQATFQAYRIPLRLQYRPRLSASAVGVFLLRLFDAVESWERDTVLDVLASPWFSKSASEARHAPVFPTLARAAQIIGGRMEWRARFTLLQKRLQHGKGRDIQALLRSVPEAEAALKAFAKTLARLGALTDMMPETDSIAGHARRFDAVIDQLELEAALDAHPDAALVVDEQRALAALRNLTAMMAALESDELQIPPSEFFQLLAQGMAETRYNLPQPDAGVWCGDAAGLRGLQFDQVYFGGLNEGVVPQAAPGNSIYSEQDLARLRAQGVELEGVREQLARQRLLFHHVLVAARRQLTLSWRMMKEGGREASRSPFLAHVQELFSDTSQIVAAAPMSDAFLPTPKAAASRRELRNALFYGRPALKAASQPYFPAAFLGARIESRRQSAQAYDVYDGVLKDPALLATLADRYGPAHHFSVNQLEAQAQCPFRFFLERVLQIDETEIPEAAFDPRVRGTMMHEALCRFHKHYEGVPTPEISEDEAETAMKRLVDEVFEQYARRSITAPPGVRTVERLQMIARLLRYLAIEREKGDGDWAPRHFEVTFGRAHHDEGPRDALSQEAPLALQTAVGQVLFAGIIDRIDVQDSWLRLIDYKSGQAPSALQITRGLTMQLTLYAWAAEQLLLPGAECREAWFLPIGNDQYREALGLGKSRNWPDREPNTRATIERAVSEIRQGYFPPRPAEMKACRGCAAAGVCRFEEQRITRKEEAVS